MTSIEFFKKNRMQTGIATDFDGTISAITAKNSDAKIDKEAKKLLAKLQRRYCLVSVISGRPVKQLARLVGIKDVVYIGNHGAEYLINQSYKVVPEALRIASLLARINQELKIYEDNFLLDYKTYSLSIHYRLHPCPETAEIELKRILSKYVKKELKIIKGRLVFDLSAQGIDKGSAVEHLINAYGLKNFLYIGDDRTDIDAFKKMNKLESSGVRTLKIALESAEAPDGLIENSDLKLHSLKEVNDLFRQLL